MRRWVAGVLTLASVGCATPPPMQETAFSGRLAVQAEAIAATRTAWQLSSAFELRGDAIRGALDLVSPLGSVMAQAHWEPGSVRLASAQGSQVFASLADLSAAALGESLPLEALFDWLRGRPWPQAPHSIRPDGFEQLGWAVDLSAFDQGRLLARRTAPPVVQMRFVLDRDR